MLEAGAKSRVIFLPLYLLRATARYLFLGQEESRFCAQQVSNPRSHVPTYSCCPIPHVFRKRRRRRRIGGRFFDREKGVSSRAKVRALFGRGGCYAVSILSLSSSLPPRPCQALGSCSSFLSSFDLISAAPSGNNAAGRNTSFFFFGARVKRSQ